MLLKTHDGNRKTKLKRTEKGPHFEGQLRRSNPKNELPRKSRVQAEGLCPGIPQQLEAAIVRRLAGSRENTKNRGNEAKKSLKTKDDALYNVQK
jgi:hypothetical protein